MKQGLTDMARGADETQMLRQAFQALTETSQAMEDAYQLLQERVQALHRELEEKNRALALSADYLGNLLESMNDGVIAVDVDGRITHFNRAASAILGYAAEQVVGSSFAGLFDRPFTCTGPPSGTVLRTRSGRPAPVQERDAGIAGPEGNRLGSVKVFQDLSELHALREQARQRERLAAIGEMAATVAHEIRNPLGGIRGFAMLLAKDVAGDAPKERLVQRIIEGTARLERIVSELLEYTRPVDLELKSVPCARIIESALSLLEYDEERIHIGMRGAADGCVLADAEKMSRVLLNLLLNAVQSIEDEGEVILESEADASRVYIRVRDTGCGMDEEQLGRIFSPFYTTKERGTGLGLSICQKIVEGHGGRIDVSSAAGAGAMVQVALPRVE